MRFVTHSPTSSPFPEYYSGVSYSPGGPTNRENGTNEFHIISRHSEDIVDVPLDTSEERHCKHTPIREGNDGCSFLL